MRNLIAIFAANKLLLLITAAIAAILIPSGAIYFENLASYDSGSVFLNGWSLWDSNSYIQIARDGYFGRYFAYFPLWPIVLRIGAIFTLGNYALAGLILNLIFSFGAAVMIWKLCKLEFKDEKTGLWANIFLFFFPTAFFLTALYAESLLLFLGVAGIYFLRKKNWWLAGIAVFFASMTKEVGGVMLLPLLYVAWKEKKWLLPMAPILGVTAVLAIYYFTSGDPLIFLKQHEGFGKTLSLPHVPIIHALQNIDNPYHAWNLFCFGFTAVLTHQVYKLLPKEYFLYCIAVLGPGLMSSNLEGYSRYLLIGFPMFMVLGKFHKKLSVKSMYVIFLLLLLIFTVRYVLGETGAFPFDRLPTIGLT
ncbi:MAG: mannosyltransferase family protein [Patescibacteria group bacterium]|nr:hypothetical protein [Patescibacteria group bacterium]